MAAKCTWQPRSTSPRMKKFLEGAFHRSGSPPPGRRGWSSDQITSRWPMPWDQPIHDPFRGRRKGDNQQAGGRLCEQFKARRRRIGDHDCRLAIARRRQTRRAGDRDQWGSGFAGFCRGLWAAGKILLHCDPTVPKVMVNAVRRQRDRGVKETTKRKTYCCDMQGLPPSSEDAGRRRSH